MPRAKSKPAKPSGVSEPAPEVSLVLTSASADKSLSKEQKRFNQLVRRIKQVRGELTKGRNAEDVLRTIHLPVVLAAEKAAITAHRALILALHESPWRERQGKKMKKDLAEVMISELHDLLGTSLYAEDAQLKELYQHYEPDHTSFDEVRAEDEEWEKSMAAEAMKNIFGVDVSPDDLDDPEKMQQHAASFMDDVRSFDQQQRQNAGKQKKKTAKQIARESEAENRRQEAESALKKTTRQIYIDLVKHFHPDREPDEALRHEKTETMKQITAAYEAGDQLRLLELQMTLLSDRENAFADFDEGFLKHFNNSLQHQLRELEMDLHFQLSGSPENPLMHLFHPNPDIMQRQVKHHVTEMKKRTRQDGDWTSRITTSETDYRDLIRQFVAAMREDDFFEEFGPPPGFY